MIYLSVLLTNFDFSNLTRGDKIAMIMQVVSVNGYATLFAFINKNLEQVLVNMIKGV